MFKLKEINNLLLDKLIEDYEKTLSKDLKDSIFEEAMNAWFVLPILKEDVDTNTYDVEWVKDYEDKIYLPIFTSYYHFLQCKTIKSNKVMICNLKLILKMYESIQDKIHNIVINPYSAEINFTKIDIAKIRGKFDMSIYRSDLNNMEIIELPKNKGCSKYDGSKIIDINIPMLFKKEIATISRFHQFIDKVYLIANFDEKQRRNIYEVIVKTSNKKDYELLHLDEIEHILKEYLPKSTSCVKVIKYDSYQNKGILKKCNPFYAKD